MVGVFVSYIVYQKYYHCNSFRKKVAKEIGESIVEKDNEKYRLLEDWRFPKNIKNLNDELVELLERADEAGEPEGVRLDSDGNCTYLEEFADKDCSYQCEALEVKREYWSRMREFQDCFLLGT